MHYYYYYVYKLLNLLKSVAARGVWFLRYYDKLDHVDMQE